MIYVAASNICASFRLAYPTDRAFSLDVDLTLPGRGITAIFGPSGSGKTTLLRCIAGLEQTDHGRLSVNGCRWQEERYRRPIHKRPLGYVFQQPSLFPHLTARGNLAYATRRSANAPSAERCQRVESLMGIEPVLDQYPAELSGGEQQRVAIARALLIDPSLLLMDEPLASLDMARKQEVMPYLERLREELDIPVLYVSHSVDEVARLADYLVILDHGRVVAHGTLSEVLTRVDLPVQLGDDTGVIVETRVVERDAAWHLVKVAFAGGELWLRDQGDAIGRSIRVRILARDVSLTLATHGDTSILNRLPAEVMEIAPDADPAMSLVRLKSGSIVVIARITRRSVEHLRLSAGHRVWAQIKSVAMVR